MAPEAVRLVTNPYSTTPFRDKNNVESSDYVLSEVCPELFAPPSAVGWHPNNGDWIDGKERADIYVERDGAAPGRVKNDFSFADSLLGELHAWRKAVESRSAGGERFPSIGPKSKFNYMRHPFDHIYRPCVTFQDLSPRHVQFNALLTYMDPTYSGKAVSFSTAQGQPIVWRSVRKHEGDECPCVHRLIFAIPGEIVPDAPTSPATADASELATEPPARVTAMIKIASQDSILYADGETKTIANCDTQGYTYDNVEVRGYSSPRAYDTYYIAKDEFIICDLQDKIYQLCAGTCLEPVRFSEIAVCTFIQNELYDFAEVESLHTVIDGSALRHFAAQRVFDLEESVMSPEWNYTFPGRSAEGWVEERLELSIRIISRVDPSKCRDGKNHNCVKKDQWVNLTLHTMPVAGPPPGPQVVIPGPRETVAAGILRHIPVAGSRITVDGNYPWFPRAAGVEVTYVDYALYGHLQLPDTEFFSRIGSPVRLIRNLVPREIYFRDMRDIQPDFYEQGSF